MRKVIITEQNSTCQLFLVFRKSGLIKGRVSFEDVSAHIFSLSHVGWCNFCSHLSSLRLVPIPHSKGPLNKIIIQIKRVGISITFHRIKLCNGSLDVSINIMFILTFNRQPCSYFWFFAELVLLNVVYLLKICQHTKFHGPLWTGASFASTSEV
jgi:hypothetical protein